MENKLIVKIDGCNTCKHDDGSYSLSLNLTNTHIDISTAPYTSTGCYSRIALFGLTKSNMYELAKQIMEVANKIEGDNDASNF